MQATARQRERRGFTLIELMVTVAVAAVLLTLAIPSFNRLIAAKRLDGVVSELATDLQYVRAEAVARQSSGVLPIYGAVATDAGGSCYVVYVYGFVFGGPQPACSCSPSTTCNAGATEIKTVRMPGGGSGVTIGSNASVSFDPQRGLASSSVAFTGTSNLSSGLTVNATVSPSGNVRVCVPNGSKMTGYSACN